MTMDGMMDGVIIVIMSGAQPNGVMMRSRGTLTRPPRVMHTLATRAITHTLLHCTIPHYLVHSLLHSLLHYLLHYLGTLRHPQVERVEIVSQVEIAWEMRSQWARPNC